MKRTNLTDRAGGTKPMILSANTAKIWLCYYYWLVDCSRSFGPAAKLLLFCASESGNTELVGQLLLAGASTGPEDVLIAKQNRHTEVAELLEIATVKQGRALEPGPVHIEYTHFPSSA